MTTRQCTETAKCHIPCGTPEAPTCPCEHAAERGERAGALYRAEGRAYGKVNGAYPSNPYHRLDPRFAAFNEGYEDGFNGA